MLHSLQLDVVKEQLTEKFNISPKGKSNDQIAVELLVLLDSRPHPRFDGETGHNDIIEFTEFVFVAWQFFRKTAAGKSKQKSAAAKNRMAALKNVRMGQQPIAETEFGTTSEETFGFGAP